ncbi:hypothetical protein RYX36_023112 [Vicia faba]
MNITIKVDALGRVPFSSIRRPRPLLEVDPPSSSRAVCSDENISTESMLGLEYPSTHVYSLKAKYCDAKHVPAVTFGGVELATPTPGALQGSFTAEPYK